MSGIDSTGVTVVSQLERRELSTGIVLNATLGAVAFGPDADLNTYPGLPGDLKPVHRISLVESFFTGQLTLRVEVVLTDVPPYPQLPQGEARIYWSGSLSIAAGHAGETLEWTDELIRTVPLTGGWGMPRPGGPQVRVPYVFWRSYGDELSISVAFPGRMAADIYSHHRYGTDNLGQTYNWGFYFLSTDPDKTVDVNPYFRDAQLYWLYWPNDGSVRVIAIGDQGVKHLTMGAVDSQGRHASPVAVAPNASWSYDDLHSGYDSYGHGAFEAVIVLERLNLSPRFVPQTLTLQRTNEQLGWGPDGGGYLTQVQLSDDRITVTSNSELPQITGTVTGGEELRLVADFLRADGTALPRQLTVSAYSPPGQPPLQGDGWYSMPILTDISFAGPGEYRRPIRRYRLTALLTPGSLQAQSPEWDLEPGVACVITPGSLEAADLEPSAWRYPLPLPVADARWVFCRLHHSRESWTLDPCLSTTGWIAGGGASLQAAPSGLRCSGPAGRWMMKTFEPSSGGSIETCRWLRLRFAEGAGGATLTINGTDWPFDIAPVVDIDLCLPPAGPVDTQETRVAPGWSWGPLNPAVVRITFDSAGEATLEAIELRPATGSDRATKVLAEVVGDVPGYGNRRRGIWHTWAGRTLLDEPIGLVSPVQPGPPPTRDLPEAYSLQAVLDGMAERLGALRSGPLWFDDNGMGAAANARPANHQQYLLLNADGTPDTNSRSYYLGRQYWNNSREAFNLEPVSAAAQEITPAWGELYSHFWADRILFGPGTMRPVVTRKIFGGRIGGLVGLNGRRAPDVAVRITSGGGSMDVTTDSDGWFASPHLWRSGQHRAALVSAPGLYGELATMFHNRRGRVSLAAVVAAPEPQVQDLFIDEVTGIGMRAYTTDTGQLMAARTLSWGLDYDLVSPVRLTGSPRRPCVFIDHVSPQRRWGIAWDEDGAVRLGWSADLGHTWELEDTGVSGITHIRVAANPASGILVLAGRRISDGQLVVARSVDGGETWSTPEAVGPIADAPFGLTCAADHQGRFVLTCLGTGGELQTWWSVNHGLTWEQV